MLGRRRREEAQLTRRHVEGGAAAEVRGEVVHGGKAKVGELDSHSLVSH